MCVCVCVCLPWACSSSLLSSSECGWLLPLVTVLALLLDRTPAPERSITEGMAATSTETLKIQSHQRNTTVHQQHRRSVCSRIQSPITFILFTIRKMAAICFHVEPINNLIPSCTAERHLVLQHVKHSLSFIELNSSLVYCMRTSSHSHISP